MWSELFPVDIVLAIVRFTPVQQLANCVDLDRQQKHTEHHPERC
jgi:hypothetical protein